MIQFYSCNIRTTLISAVFLIMALVSNGKTPVLNVKELETPPPKIIRTCCLFGADVHVAVIPFVKFTNIISLSELGEHSYLGGKKEGNGIIYTRRGGFIDIGHLRDCADWTAYLYSVIRASKNYPFLQIIKLGYEGGKITLHLNISEVTDSTDLYELAGKIAYDLSLWHEIATWYGTSYVPMIPERYSSFSPEDLYSNLLGTKLGIKALKSNLDYNQAMTQLISETLDSLDAVETYDETFQAMQKVEEIWWTNDKSLPSKKILIKRYFDSDFSLVPWLLPDKKNYYYPNVLLKYEEGLNTFFQLNIRLNYHFPVKTIFGKRKNYRIVSQFDFDTMLCDVENNVDHLESKIAAHQSRKEFRKQRRLSNSI